MAYNIRSMNAPIYLTVTVTLLILLSARTWSKETRSPFSHNAGTKRPPIPAQTSPVPKTSSMYSNLPLLKHPDAGNPKKQTASCHNEMEAIFESLHMPEASLTERILAVESRVCGNVCGPDFPSSSVRWNERVACQACQCDATCVQYNNCCPDVYLLQKANYSDGPGSECSLMAPTESDLITDDKLNTNYHRFSSVITECPKGSPASNNEEPAHRYNTQRRKCERPDKAKFDEALPVSDASTNLTYRNIHCARCNNVSSLSIHRWDINLGCKTPAKLLKYRHSKMALYHKLNTLTGVQNTDCELTYVSPDLHDGYRRSCRRARSTLISRCSPVYPKKHYSIEVEKACRKYTSVYLERFKNVFCYICNKLGYVTGIQELIEITTGLGVHAENHINPLDMLFSEVVDFSSVGGYDDDDDVCINNEEGEVCGNGKEAAGHEETISSAEECSSTQIFDNTTFSCRDIKCDQWMTFNPETKDCYGGLVALGMNYWACQRVYVDFTEAPAYETLLSLNKELRKFVPKYGATVSITEWCPGDERLTLHLKSMAVNEYDLETTFSAEGKDFCEFLQEHENAVKLCALDMVEEVSCTSTDKSTFPCIPLNSIEFRTKNVISSSMGLVDYYDLVTLPYKKTDHCAFVEIPAAHFNESESALTHRLSARHIDRIWVEFMQNDTLIRICLDDYLKWSLTEIGRRHLIIKSGKSSATTWKKVGPVSIAITYFLSVHICLRITVHLV